MTQQLEKAPSRSTDLDRVRALQIQGLHLQAYALLRTLAPQENIENLTAARELLLAGRVIQHCGAPQLSARLVRRAYHRDRLEPECIYFFSRHLLERRGPLACLRFMERQNDLPGADDTLRADWYALRAATFGAFRDFPQAHQWIDKALTIAPREAWIHLEHAFILEAQDRYPEALASAQAALRLRPGFRPGIQHAAQLHLLLGDDHAALDLLRSAAATCESMFVLMQLVSVEQELHLYDDARRSLARFDAVTPLLEKPLRLWKNAREYELAYAAGDFPAALTLGETLEDPYVKPVLERLRECLAKSSPTPPGTTLPTPRSTDHDPPRRMRLPVGFVRQHHMTCVPATLSTLCRYWNLPADHLQISEQICYDGTPPHKERAWVESAGHIAREFTLTWQAGIDLINRGIPFVLTTVHPENGHAQAVIGYDSVQRVFLIRDPYNRSAVEFRADPALEYFRSSGPRCLILLPQDQAHRLEGIALPEEKLYDLLYRIQQSLETHDRAQAQQAHEQLQSAAPGHRITLYSTRCLAGYDGNRTAVLTVTEDILKLHPDDANTKLTKFYCLRDLARRDDRIALLRDLCAQKKTHPMFWQRFAEEIIGDARQTHLAVRLLERRIRRTPRAAMAYQSLARAFWTRQQFDAAFQLFRIAACMDEKDERLAQSYFDAARYFRQTDFVLEFLRERVTRFGNKSSAPGRTLFQALLRLNRIEEAFQVLEQALAQRPQDGYLLTFAAESCVRHQKVERGQALLRQAKDLAHPLSWLSASAETEQHLCHYSQALALWRQIAQQDPLNMHALAAIARLLAQTESRAATLAYLRALVDSFPHHFGLLQLLISWERSESFPQRESTLRRMLELDSANAWAHREYADLLSDAGRHEEALAAAQQAELLEPTDDRTANSAISVHERAGRVAQARSRARQALELSVDNQFAMSALLRLCNSTDERRTELRFVQEQLARQVIFGESLLLFRFLAGTVLEPAELALRLREAHADRPDLWQSWSALIRQLTAMHESTEAESLALQAVKRMPLVPRLWVDLAHVYVEMGQRDQLVSALEEALALSPGWDLPSGMLATVYQRQADLPKARYYLEAAVMHQPMHAPSHASLAELLWTQGEKQAAVDRLQRALELDSENENFWERLHAWGKLLGTPQLAEQKLRDFTQKRGGEAGGWRRLARILPTDSDEALAAVRKAIALEPLNPDNHDMLAGYLGASGKFDEAEKACAPTVFGAAIPRTLRARAAWVLMRRGKRKEAIAAMREVLQLDQSNFWAWNRLAEWLQQEGDKDAYLQTAIRMTQLWPAEPGALEIAAHARLLVGGADHRVAAKAALRRTLELDPTRLFAATNLFNLQLQDKEWLLAESTVRLLRQQGNEAAAILADARLGLARLDPAAHDRILKDAQRMFMLPGAARYHYEELLKVVAPTKLRAPIDRALFAAAQNEKCNPNLPAVAVAVAASTKNWKAAASVLRKAPPGSDGWNKAWHQFINVAAQFRQVPLTVKLIREQRAALCAEPDLWGSIGYFYAHCARWNDGIRWLADYRDRPNIAGWMISNLVVCLFMRRKFAPAAAACRFGLNAPLNDAHHSHVLWLALLDPAAFVAPQGDALRHALEHGPDGGRSKFDRNIHPAASICVALARATHEGRTLKISDIKKHWDALQPAQAGKDRSFKRIYSLTYRRLIRRGSIPLKLAALNRWLQTLNT